MYSIYVSVSKYVSKFVNASICMLRCFILCVLPSSKTDLAHVAYGVLFSVNLSADASSTAPGLDNRVGWRGRDLIVMWVWLAIRFLPCHDLFAFFLQRQDHRLDSHRGRHINGNSDREGKSFSMDRIQIRICACGASSISNSLNTDTTTSIAYTVHESIHPFSTAYSDKGHKVGGSLAQHL